MMKEATCFAPATVANVGVGFDILGFPVNAVGDTVTVRRLDDERGVVRLEALEGAFAATLPIDTARNSATVGLVRLAREKALPFGFSVRVRKGIPLGSGMGGSAASSVGALVAANALLPAPLSREELLAYSLDGEVVATGATHGDNVAPCLFGGLVLTRAIAPVVDVRQVPTPSSLRCVVVHPGVELETRTARGILSTQVALRAHVRQSSNLAGFLLGCMTGDIELIGRSLSDEVIEPQRAPLIPGFPAVKAAALGAGALGCSISGSGPAVFALTARDDDAARVRDAMVRAFQGAGVTNVSAWISPIRTEGATLV